MKSLKRFLVYILVLALMAGLLAGGVYLKFIREYKQKVQAQSTDVDTVSGATCSSRVIRKAVENALTQGLAQSPAPEVPAIDPGELVGPWHLAEENDAIYDAFPGSMEFGSTMEIRSNGSIAWYIGAEGGVGTYTREGNILHCALRYSLDDSPMTMDFTARKRDGQLLLTTVYRDLELCWRWGEGESGRGEEP